MPIHTVQCHVWSAATRQSSASRLFETEGFPFLVAQSRARQQCMQHLSPARIALGSLG
jgi:hypothetical protein